MHLFMQDILDSVAGDDDEGAAARRARQQQQQQLQQQQQQQQQLQQQQQQQAAMASADPRKRLAQPPVQEPPAPNASSSSSSGGGGGSGATLADLFGADISEEDLLALATSDGFAPTAADAAAPPAPPAPAHGSAAPAAVRHGDPHGLTRAGDFSPQRGPGALLSQPLPPSAASQQPPPHHGHHGHHVPHQARRDDLPPLTREGAEDPKAVLRLMPPGAAGCPPRHIRRESRPGIFSLPALLLPSLLHTDRQTDKHIETRADRQTRTHRHRHTHAQTPTQTHTQIQAQTHAHTHTLSISRTLCCCSCERYCSAWRAAHDRRGRAGLHPLGLRHQLAQPHQGLHT